MGAQSWLNTLKQVWFAENQQGLRLLEPEKAIAKYKGQALLAWPYLNMVN